MVNIKRIGSDKDNHWHTRLYHPWLMEVANKPFKWGEWDCCLAAADGIKVQTGVDIAADFRGKYTDQASAFATIKAITGGSTVADAAAYCANKFGLSEWKYPLMAQRGDLVVVEDAGNLVAGLVHLNGRHVVVVAEDGLHRVSISKVKRAWRVA
ncbi:hypothetical protein HNQ77_002664 [Silvibacterium bohemicum]|uniref:DUF6950 domain-containing protein n=1 Tax=Silvibacterium bohemicum TaxID=1577686 RepID=A0A841K234_9BACT|nr:hypothetical protein [Silvibacterium bohemicum]MBB6144708.1 hypothetical protein [Silvibacterium bohemicum]